MTEDLDQELVESQRIMKEIKALFDNVPKQNDNNQDNNNGQANNSVRHEDMSKFLEASVPKLLMSDMPENTVEVDLDDVIASMKNYAEDLRKNILPAQPPPRNSQRVFENLDIKQYASTLDQLAKRLANIKLIKKDEVNNRNADLEEKLTQLCQDVNLFTQMVETKTTISECNKNWPDNQEDNNILYYENIINKLLAGINEVTYLLKNKN
ncbi:unnamed protein product, partial [Iphiclides podalirius]